MKKSRSIRLVLLGGASVALAACGDDGPPKDARFFSNLQECAAVYDMTQCLDAQKQADQTFAAQAPKFTRKEECETEFGAGNCEPKQITNSGGNSTGGNGSGTSTTNQSSSSGGSFFMPMLMGYMMGNMLGGQSRFNEPVYRGPNGSALTQNSSGKMFNIGSFSGVGRSAATSFRSSPATQVGSVSRGGFGSTSTAFRSSAGS